MNTFSELRRLHVEALRAYTPEAVSHLEWSADRVRKEQTTRLRKVIAHAQRCSLFYGERLNGVDADTITLENLPDLPFLTKSDVMENWDQLVTDPELQLTEVTAHLQRLKSGEETNPYYLGKYCASATGGSSGKRGLFLWDWETFAITANIAYRMEAQADAVAPPTGLRRTAVICAGSPVHASHLLFPVSLDPQRETRIFPAGTTISDLVAQLNEWQPDRLVGYASIVQELCSEALHGALAVRLNRISTNSEPLLAEARQMALKAWGINIHDTWGSVEIGVAASEGEAFSGLSLAEDFLIFEAVDGQDRPTSNPDQVERMLVTKLFGDVMPMIRYEMTDTLILDDTPNSDAPGYRRIRGIKGRSDAWFVYPGRIRIHPMIFRDILGQEPDISEYQVRQTAAGAQIGIVCRGSFDVPALTRAIQRSLAGVGLPDAPISIELVAELPRHAETNKLVRFVPLVLS
jgi:phenylacetate-CoA ligase